MLLFVFSAAFSYGQSGNYIHNPSLELPILPDTIGSPLGWTRSQNSPDIQPFKFDVKFEPQNGDTYMAFYTYYDYSDSAYNEGVYQKLKFPFSQDSCYSMGMYLSKGESAFTDIALVGEPFLEVYGSGSESDLFEDTLIVSPLIDHVEEWKLYKFSFCPTVDIRYITLEGGSGQTESTYLYIDNITEISSFVTPIQKFLGEDKVMCFGEQLILDATVKNAQYEWQDGSENSVFEVTESGQYTVEVALSNVAFYDTINVSFYNCNIEIPNVFTPNGDKVNDFFVIDSNVDLELNIEVYNRWGKLVYEDVHYQNNWGGSNLSDGMYFYKIESKRTRKEYEGWVEILR